MALVKCPECATEVSEKAHACPKCAHPIASDGPAIAGSAAKPAVTLAQRRWIYLNHVGGSVVFFGLALGVLLPVCLVGYLKFADSPGGSFPERLFTILSPLQLGILFFAVGAMLGVLAGGHSASGKLKELQGESKR
jgi:hypothetical protein